MRHRASLKCSNHQRVYFPAATIPRQLLQPAKNTIADEPDDHRNGTTSSHRAWSGGLATCPRAPLGRVDCRPRQFRREDAIPLRDKCRDLLGIAPFVPARGLCADFGSEPSSVRDTGTRDPSWLANPTAMILHRLSRRCLPIAVRRKIHFGMVTSTTGSTEISSQFSPGPPRSTTRNVDLQSSAINA